LSALTAIFGSAEDKSPDSDKLLQLYWNRAELKKEFASMRKEQFHLQDRIKQQEGATARLQQKLDHLEDLLLDPDWAHNVVTFFQLRGLAIRCERKLARFAEQLKQQREQKQHSSLLVNWNEELAREVRVLERKLLEQRDNVHMLEDRLQAERHRLLSMSGLLRFFRRRSVTAALDSLAEQIEAARLGEAQIVASIDEVNARTPPENQGLDVASKRSINLMILAFAQQLYLHFADDKLSALAKEASDKSVGAINYGSREECEVLLNRVRKRRDAMEQSNDFAAVLQKRARLIGEKAQFRNDTDAVPIAGSVSIVFNIDPNGLVRESEANLLGENYWGISKVLSR
jgi:predicted  nucleic acid-binding Zn-ribbon protein